MLNPPRKVKIVGLKNEINRGDDQNVLGTLRAVCDLYKQKKATVCSSIVYLQELAKLKNLVSCSQEKTILLGAGEQSLNPLIEVERDPRLTRHIYTSWSGHQLCVRFEEAALKLDSIALPQHVVTSKVRELLQRGNVTLVETIGVPHNLQPEDLESAYQEWKPRFLKAPRYTLAILGGDAPKPEGTRLYYTREEAARLARFLAPLIKKEKGTVLLGTNGPRTGQYDPLTSEPSHAHYKSHPDPVTETFTKTLETAGLKDGLDFQFFDFKFVKNRSGYRGVSAYKALLGALAQHPGSSAYLPGESTSIISEACDCLTTGAAFIYANTAMNDTHHAHVASVGAAGYARCLYPTNDGFTLGSSEALTSQKSRKPCSAAQTVAESILTNFPP